MTPARLAILQAKWHILPDRQTNAVLYRQTAPGTYSANALTAAFRRPKGYLEADVSNGVYLVEKVDWWVPKAVYSAQPYPGDYLLWPHPIHGDVAYTVGKDGVDEVGALGTWCLHTVRPNLNAALTRVVNVYRPQPGQDAGGGVTRGNPTTLASNIPAAVEVLDTFKIAPVEQGVTFGKLQLPNPVRVYIAVTIRVQPHDYLIDSTGVTYTVQNDSNVNRIGEFMALDCLQTQ